MISRDAMIITISVSLLSYSKLEPTNTTRTFYICREMFTLFTSHRIVVGWNFDVAVKVEAYFYVLTPVVSSGAGDSKSTTLYYIRIAIKIPSDD